MVEAICVQGLGIIAPGALPREPKTSEFRNAPYNAVYNAENFNLCSTKKN